MELIRTTARGIQRGDLVAVDSDLRLADHFGEIGAFLPVESLFAARDVSWIEIGIALVDLVGAGDRTDVRAHDGSRAVPETTPALIIRPTTKG